MRGTDAAQGAAQRDARIKELESAIAAHEAAVSAMQPEYQRLRREAEVDALDPPTRDGLRLIDAIPDGVPVSWARDRGRGADSEWDVRVGGDRKGDDAVTAYGSTLEEAARRAVGMAVDAGILPAGAVPLA